MSNHYETLGISINASEKEIKSAYKVKLNEYRDNPEELQYINDAFEILNNKEKKREYDTYLIHGEEINNLTDNAENAMENENYKRAIEYFKKILEIQDSLKDIKRHLAWAYSKDGQYNMALSQIKELISMDKNYTYFIDMGYIYGFLGDLKKQEASFAQAHNLENNYDTMNILADFYKNNGSYEKSADFIDSCMKNDPENPFKDFSYLIKKMNVYIEGRSIDGVEKTIEKIKQITPQSKNKEVSEKFNELIDNAIDLENFELLEILCETALYFDIENPRAARLLEKLRDDSSDEEDTSEDNVSEEEEEEERYGRNEKRRDDDSHRQKSGDNSFINTGDVKISKGDFIIEGLICAVLSTVLFPGTIGLLLWLFVYLPLKRKHNIEKHNKYNIPKVSVIQKIIGYFIIIFTTAFVAEDRGSSFVFWLFIGFILGYILFCVFLHLCEYLGIKNTGTNIEQKLGFVLRNAAYKIIPFIKDNRYIVEEKLEIIKDKTEGLDDKANEYIENIKEELKDRSESIKGSFPFKKAGLIAGCICVAMAVVSISIFGAVKLLNSDKKNSEISLYSDDYGILKDFSIRCDKDINSVGNTGNVVIDSVYPDSIDKKKIDLYISSGNPNVISVSNRKLTAVGSGRCDVVVSSGNIQKTLSFNIEEGIDDLNKGNYLRKESNREYLEYDSLTYLSTQDLSFIKNEIFARHGYKFKEEPYVTYFNSQDWYKGTKDSVSNSEFNKYELSNIDTINSILRSRQNQNNDSNKSNSLGVYKNSRFGYSISYPSIFKNRQESDNGEGIRMSNDNNTIFMSAYGLNNVSNESATLRFNTIINNSRSDNIEYQYNDGSKYVISWTDAQGMEYYRCEVVGTGSINGFLVWYPQSEGDYMNQIIEKMYKSFETPNINK